MIVRTSGKVYNPATNQYEGEKTFISGSAVQSSFKMENVDGTVIKAGDVKLLCVFDESPVVGDVIEFGGKTYKVVNFDKLSPDGVTAITYTLQCR